MLRHSAVNRVRLLVISDATIVNGMRAEEEGNGANLNVMELEVAATWPYMTRV